MASAFMNAARLIISVAGGIAMAYFWMIMRGEGDIPLLVGIGIITTIMVYTLLHFLGKGSGG